MDKTSQTTRTDGGGTNESDGTHGEIALAIVTVQERARKASESLVNGDEDEALYRLMRAKWTLEEWTLEDLLEASDAE